MNCRIVTPLLDDYWYRTVLYKSADSVILVHVASIEKRIPPVDISTIVDDTKQIVLGF